MHLAGQQPPALVDSAEQPPRILVRYDDLELVKQPVLVVARWDGKGRSVARGIVGRVEQAQIVVERVIVGDVQPGRMSVGRCYSVLLPKRTDRRDGLLAGMVITNIGFPELEDATDPHLWFLQRAKPGEGVEWNLATGTGLQPLRLESYYHALRQPDRDARMGPFLASKDPISQLRALRYVSGGNYLQMKLDTWRSLTAMQPNERRIYLRSVLHPPLPEYADAVRPLTASRDPLVRRAAVKVYAWLAQEKSLPLLKTLAQDPDREVRETVWHVLPKEGKLWKPVEAAP